MAWLTSPAWVALFLRATGSLAAIFTFRICEKRNDGNGNEKAV